MIRGALSRPTPLELTADPRFAARVKRLALTSAIALGLIWALAVMTLAVPIPVHGALAAGWLLMPTLLVASLTRPRLRLALVLPASLVGVGLLAIALAWLPDDPVAALGWLLMAAGVLLGGVLGLWLWLRVVPVPPQLEDPFSSGRWLLIGIHVALIALGLALAALPLARL